VQPAGTLNGTDLRASAEEKVCLGELDNAVRNELMHNYCDRPWWMLKEAPKWQDDGIQDFLEPGRVEKPSGLSVTVN